MILAPVQLPPVLENLGPEEEFMDQAASFFRLVKFAASRDFIFHIGKIIFLIQLKCCPQRKTGTRPCARKISLRSVSAFPSLRTTWCVGNRLLFTQRPVTADWIDCPRSREKLFQKSSRTLSPHSRSNILLLRKTALMLYFSTSAVFSYASWYQTNCENKSELRARTFEQGISVPSVKTSAFRSCSTFLICPLWRR